MKGFIKNSSNNNFESRMLEAVDTENPLETLNTSRCAKNKQILSTNDTFDLKTSKGMLRQIIILDDGASWNYEIQDGAGFQTGAVPIAAADVGKVLNMDLRMDEEIKIITTGTTPGKIIVTWD